MVVGIAINIIVKTWLFLFKFNGTHTNPTAIVLESSYNIVTH
jgi:hypothetical protein